MRNQPVFKLNRQALIAVIISVAFPIISNAAAGRVEFAIGNVTASGTDGRERRLAKGAEINNGDTIQTSDGRTQIKFTDGGYMSLQPNTQFKVDDYAYDGKADGSEKGFFKLVKGGLRAITGAIGHTNRATYSINTPVAIIGIRGTEFTGEYHEEGDEKKLVVHVSDGSLFLQNGGGDLILFQGQSGVVTDENQQPGYTDEETLITAQGPGGDSAEENEEEQQQEQEQSLVFTDAEQVNSDGIPDAIDDNPLAGVLASYSAQNAVGFYDLDTSGSITGIANTASGEGEYGRVSAQLLPGSTLTAYFGSYTIVADLSVLLEEVDICNDSCYQHSYIRASGGIIPANASFSLTGSGAGYDHDYDPLCDSGCVFTATGLFFGSTAQNARIDYRMTDSGGPGYLNGTAGFKLR